MYTDTYGETREGDHPTSGAFLQNMQNGLILHMTNHLQFGNVPLLYFVHLVRHDFVLCVF
jgi:hypothetical protein